MSSHTERRPALSIVAPMFNEAENVDSTVAAIHDAMRDFDADWELVLVNDGSTDDTLDRARRVAENNPHVRVVSYPTNAGRGRALRTGFAVARGEIVVTIDFDLSYSPDHILAIYRTLNDRPDVDVVLASPYMPGGRTEGVPRWRLFWSRLGNRVLRWSFGGQFYTHTCIVRGYRRHVLESLELSADGKEIHLEILSKAVALGYRIVEIPATLRWRRRARTSFRLRAITASHLLFSVFERPMLMFGLLGLAMLVVGSAVGLYLLREWRIGLVDPNNPFHPDRPLMTVLVVFLLAGIQFLSFGFLAMQLVALRRELYVVQRENRELLRALAHRQQNGER